MTGMTHCTPDELLDVVDGARSIASLPHMADCAACRAQLDELRATIGEVGAVGVPEPPPHYWRQLAMHVREAVQREQGGGGWRPWLGVGVSWQTVWPVAAVAVLVLAVLVVPRGAFERRPPSVPPHAPAPGTPTVGSSVRGTSEPVQVDRRRAPGETGVGDTVNESLIAFMQDLAEGMDSEAAGAWLRPDVSVADAAVEALSDDERVEMQRLIQEAIRASGA